MKLDDLMQRQGTWLFRWRSYLPLVLLAFGFMALLHASLLDRSYVLDQCWTWFSFVVALAGVLIRAYTVGCAPHRTSGRNTKEQVADTLNTTGIYSVVRHPLYIGNFLTWLGTALFTQQWVFILLVVAVFALYHERIILLEERFLEEKFGDQFRAWAARTPAFLGRLRLWQPSALPFSWRHALKREYLGLFGLISAFFVLDLVRDKVVSGHWTFNALWAGVMFGGTIMFCAVRYLRKRTRTLEVQGR